MGYGASIFLIALGAILAFAVELQEQVVAGVTIQWDVVGFIMMVVGVIGLIWAAVLSTRSETVIERDDRPVTRERIRE